MDTCRDHPESFGPKILRPICQLQHPESVGTPRIPESTSHRVTRGDNMAASTATPRRSKAAVLPADLRRLERGASRGSVRAARLRRQLHTLAGRQVLHRRVAGPPTVRTDCSLPALIRPLTPAFLSPAAPTATAIATRIAVDVRRVVVPMPTHAPLDQPRAHAPTVTPSHDKRPRRPRGPRGTVTLIEMCSGSVGFVALVMDQRWVVWHFRRQSRARRPDSRPRSDQPFRFAIGSR